MTARWQFVDVLFVVGLGGALAWLARFAANTLSGTPITDLVLPRTPGELALSAALSLATLAAIGIVASRRSSPRQLLGLKLPNRRWAVITAALAGGLLVLKLGLVAVVAELIDPSAIPTTPVTGLHGWLLLGNLAVIGGLTALEEEALYRGVLYGWLRAVIGPRAGMLFSGLLFGLAHHGAAAGIVPATVAGVVLAWTYQRSGSLWACVSLHAFNNMATLGVIGAAGSMEILLGP